MCNTFSSPKTRASQVTEWSWLLSSARMGLCLWPGGHTSCVLGRVGGNGGKRLPSRAPCLEARLFHHWVKLSRLPIGGVSSLHHSQPPHTSFCLAPRDRPIWGYVCMCLGFGRKRKRPVSITTDHVRLLSSRFPTSSGAWGSVTLVRGGILGGEDESGEALLCPGALPGHLL